MERVPQYIHLVPGSLPPALQNQPTRTLVVLDQLVDPEWQHSVSRWLLQTGCLYMLAWGAGCSSWDDSVDLANLEIFDYGEIPEGSDALTTWHADEPLAECLWFVKNSAVHPTVELERTVIVHIGQVARQGTLLAAYAEA